MDDTAVASNRRSRLGPGASMLVIGLLAGLGLGWVLWKEGPGVRSAPSSQVLPGPESGTLIEGVNVTADPILGDEAAPVTIVEFSDFECPFCERFAQRTAPILRRQYGDQVRWIFINNPLQSIHPNAYDLALAGECAHEQSLFWEWYDAMFSGHFSRDRKGVVEAAQAIGVDFDRFSTCYEDAEHAAEVEADLKEAQKFYIFGTPTFFVNGRRLEGALPPEAFAQVIDAALESR